MTSMDLQDVSVQLNNKISSIKRSMQLKNMCSDPSLTKVLQKIGLELSSIRDTLDIFQMQILQQRTELKSLQDLRNAVLKNSEAAHHLLENIPVHLPKKAAETSTADSKDARVQEGPANPEPDKNSAKNKHFVREIEYLLMEEFNSVPGYMKGRMTYDQINAVIKELNATVKAKYKILNQPMKSMSNPIRNQYHAFKEQETKETKGQYFFVEADIKDFTHLKVDKKFHVILNILRHCHRLREVRGSHLVRYVLL
ncbi:spindle and kinetochore-associated protein 1 [Carcharodon carcharias]|uniref:spindle and kinetochore-associated protein 1 n=1 Tax=Carcharodon carcharias TaxID=13397 RepID=UPI001B7E453B|nr:spindle and kinetochore-associated protein 1 [Carcharodon carcharias]XP_041044939.1 spindle and kinetochore-associated protein 1 [Carcharodon carcharias]